MRRRCSVEEYSQKINKIYEKIDNIGIGSDIIVGFPSETEQDFTDTYNNLKKLPLSYIHVFTYSERKGTPASVMENQVPQYIKKARNKTLKKFAKSKNFKFREKQLNKTLKVLVEVGRDNKTGFLRGLSDNYISVLIDGDDSLKNKIVNVKVSEVDEKNTK